MMTPEDMYYDMIGKCRHKDHRMYRQFGALGIGVSDEFLVKATFIEWATPQWPTEGRVDLGIRVGAYRFGPDTAVIIRSPEDAYVPPPNAIYEEEIPFERMYLDEEEYEQRQDMCLACEHLIGTRCRKFCSCSGDLHESRRRDIRCPVGNW